MSCKSYPRRLISHLWRSDNGYRSYIRTRYRRGVAGLLAQEPSEAKFEKIRIILASSGFLLCTGLALSETSTDVTKLETVTTLASKSTSTKAEAEAPTMIATNLTPGMPARNVMLHRLRSVKARDMNEKYAIDWKNVLGEGAYGAVHKARLKSTGEKVALKKISKRFTNNVNFRNETDALLRIYDNGGHPNISGLRDMYEDYDNFYLILDLVDGGEMFDHLVNYGAYSEADAARLMQEVSSALAFLHGVGIVHADLKPENLLICSTKQSDGTIKMIDFGCSVVHHDNYHDDYEDDEEDDETFGLFDDRKSIEARHTMRKIQKFQPPSTGTTAYWPPERFESKLASPAADMWSVGVILYIMLTGVHPFDIQGMSTDEEIEERIKTDPRPPITPRLTGHLSPSAVDLIKKLMDPDPNRRLSAYGMLTHPWVRGDTATTSIMAGSDKKLSRFKDLQDQLEAGIFSVLVSQSVDESGSSRESAASATTNIMKKVFDTFDEGGKGFVTANDVGSKLKDIIGDDVSSKAFEDMVTEARRTGGDAIANYGNIYASSSEEQDSLHRQQPLDLSLSDFSNLFANLKRRHFPKGHIIFEHGDVGDAMYFINSGKVDIKTRTGKLVAILRHGSFFGEGSLLGESTTRNSSAYCATPVDVIEISRDDFERYMSRSTDAKRSLKMAWSSRLLSYAKNMIRFHSNVKLRVLHNGDTVYKEGDEGTSMFFVDEQDGGILDVYHGHEKVHRYHPGDSFGESSVLFKRPRSSTVVCAASKQCKLHEMSAKDLLTLVESSPEHAASLRDMCRKRFLKKAIFGGKEYSQEDLRAAFDDADLDKSGTLKINELRVVMRKMDPNYPEEDIVELMKSLDLDEDGSIEFEEFYRIFRGKAVNETKKSTKW